MHVHGFEAWGRWRNTNPRGVAVLDAMLEGARTLGHKVTRSPQNEGYQECDIAVMWGCGKWKFPETRVRDEIIAAHNGPFVHLERGYWKRYDYHSVGLGGLWGLGDYRTDSVGPERREETGMPNPILRRDTLGHVLVPRQLQRDTHCQDTDMDAWYRWVQFRCKSELGRECRLRPHPMEGGSLPSIEDDLRNAWGMIAFNSTAAVDAIVHGVPVLFTDKRCILNIHYEPETWCMPRREFFDKLVHTQWTIDEMKNGRPWQHLFS